MARDYEPLASDEPVIEIDSFELVWAKYKFAIIGGVIAVVAIGVGIFAYVAISHTNRMKSEAAFAAAKDVDAYQAVIKDYPKSVVAGNAALLLAGELRSKNKVDDADQVLQNFIDAQPKHPLAPLAKVALAENTAQGGKLDQAEQDLQQVADVDSKSFAAPFALMLEAELQLAQWKRNDALRTYQQLENTYPDAVATQASDSQFNVLEAMSRPVSQANAKSPAAAGNLAAQGSEQATEQAPDEQ